VPQARFVRLLGSLPLPGKYWESSPFSRIRETLSQPLSLQRILLGEGYVTATELQQLLDAAKNLEITPEQKEEQRRSFAFGNTNIENPRVTRETVDNEAEALKGK
jgi:hypothetical protein